MCSSMIGIAWLQKAALGARVDDVLPTTADDALVGLDPDEDGA